MPFLHLVGEFTHSTYLTPPQHSQGAATSSPPPEGGSRVFRRFFVEARDFAEEVGFSPIHLFLSTGLLPHHADLRADLQLLEALRKKCNQEYGVFLNSCKITRILGCTLAKGIEQARNQIKHLWARGGNAKSPAKDNDSDAQLCHLTTKSKQVCAKGCEEQ
ncbi:MAG: hypothetical protein AUJ92_21255 [Armatimonadetes bacterium CG2_30_59_28]|nr:MAG: hypothetical protein AUJ92_21255 [Armatimonadetes bacterium CG2_30_59_28]